MHVQGKAAIDVICNPLGKSGGALIQQFMIIGFGSLAASTPYLGAILLGITLLWINAAASLNLQFIKLKAESEYSGVGCCSTSACQHHAKPSCQLV
jgi:AAA family ATP:ADP antiporter